MRHDGSGERHGLRLSIVCEIIDLSKTDLKYSRSAKYGGPKQTIHFSTNDS